MAIAVVTVRRGEVWRRRHVRGWREAPACPAAWLALQADQLQLHRAVDDDVVHAVVRVAMRPVREMHAVVGHLQSGDAVRVSPLT